jgi:integrase
VWRELSSSEDWQQSHRFLNEPLDPRADPPRLFMSRVASCSRRREVHGVGASRRQRPTIRAAAKLPEDVSLHALRHTFGSMLLADGVPVKHVSFSWFACWFPRAAHH